MPHKKSKVKSAEEEVRDEPEDDMPDEPDVEESPEAEVVPPATDGEIKRLLAEIEDLKSRQIEGSKNKLSVERLEARIKMLEEKLGEKAVIKARTLFDDLFGGS